MMGEPERDNNSSSDPVSTTEYSAGSDEYSAPEEKSSSGGGNGYEFWKPLGFETRADYIAYLQRQQNLLGPLPRGTPVPDADRPEDQAGDIGDGLPEYLRPRRRQVNVKLRDGEGADLDRAAKIYGLAPTTLARLLVNRGVAAILEKYD